jgi:GNAT superfamily N-acetyltransferase
MAARTGVFKPLEISALREVLDDYHATARDEGHRSITCEADQTIQGFAYFAPTPMTDRTWHLYWIVVDKDLHARGIGSRLLDRVESAIRQADGRLLIIETSSLDHYALTRQFYLKHRYDQSVIIPDFYSDGDGMVVFRKRLATD